MLDVFCRKCGILVGPADFECTECGNIVGESKCHLCLIKLDHLNKFECDRLNLADGRTVLLCTQCKGIYDDGIKIAKEKGIKIDHSVRM